MKNINGNMNWFFKGTLSKTDTEIIREVINNNYDDEFIKKIIYYLKFDKPNSFNIIKHIINNIDNFYLKEESIKNELTLTKKVIDLINNINIYKLKKILINNLNIAIEIINSPDEFHFGPNSLESYYSSRYY